MTEHAEEEGIVSTGALDFTVDRRTVRIGSQDVDSEPAQGTRFSGGLCLRA